MDVEGVHTTDRFHDQRSATRASPRRDDRERNGRMGDGMVTCRRRHTRDRPALGVSDRGCWSGGSRGGTCRHTDMAGLWFGSSPVKFG